LVKAAENVRDEIPEIVKRHAKERLP